MGKIKKILTNWRVIMLLFFILFALITIRPTPGNEGVTIRSVVKDSAAMLSGIENPSPKLLPLQKERIIAINNVPILDVDDYYSQVKGLKINQTITIKTNRKLYRLTTKEAFNITETGEKELKEITELVTEEVNGTNVSRDVKKTIEVPKTISTSLGVDDIGLRISNAPTTNIRKGLDLEGGTRVLLQPAEDVTSDAISLMSESLKERLNVYGLSDILVNVIKDKPGFLGEQNYYILVEIAGATEEEVRELLSKQGKFEAKVANKTVFKGGNDVTYVCRTAECSGIDPQQGCGKSQGGWSCGFQFSISLSPEAAQRQADATKNLNVISNYLEEPLVLYLDDQEVDRLNIAEDLKGRAVTDIAISGSGAGISQQEAMQNTLDNMKKLQTVLITGSLPVKLNVIKIDNISPFLGNQFIQNALFVGMLAIIAVSAMIYIRYRRFSIVLPIVFTNISEVIMLLGFAALVKWNIDLAAIAGVIISVGTGVDHLIIITDELLNQEVSYGGLKEQIKRAFSIILSTFFTTAVAMVPLLFAGAGLLKGFALVTLAGLVFGVFIARPAFGEILRIILEK